MAKILSIEETKKIEKEIKKTESDSNKKIGAFLDISIEKTIGNRPNNQNSYCHGNKTYEKRIAVHRRTPVMPKLHDND